MKITDFARTLAIVLPCLAIGYVDGAFASSGYCREQHLTKGVTNRAKDQFLYRSKGAWEARNGYYCGDKRYDSDTEGDECNNGHIILMPDGHVWQENINGPAFYTCVTTGTTYRFARMSLSDMKEIKPCTSLPAYMKSSGITTSIGGELVTYYCANGICTLLNSDRKAICYVSKYQEACLKATSGGTKWNAATKSCDCTQKNMVWDKSEGKCVKDKKAESQECYNRKGYLDSGGACRCRDDEWFDPTATNPSVPSGKGLCRPTSQCPEGMTCPPGQVININNNNTFGDIGNVTDSGNSNVNTNQQNQQVNDNNQTTSNSSENNNSNENHNNSDNVNVNNGGGQGGKTSLQKCLEDPRRAGNQELLACCYLKASGAAGGNPNFATGKCVCNDGGKTFSIAANGRGQCIGNGGNGGGGGGGDSTPQCSDRMYYNATERRCMCSAENQTEIDNNTACKCAIAGATNDANGNCKCDDPKKVIVDGQCVYNANTQCPNGMKFDTVSGNCKCINPYQREINNYTACECTVPGAKNDANGICKCNEEGKTVQNGQCVYDENAIVNIRAKITASYGKLNSTMGGFEKSVWKDAEGNFNTARLASDSIAGVVLGTAGGIITSKLVKKNQLKQGFEDIKCSIGGQNVASYGDSFSVGM